MGSPPQIQRDPKRQHCQKAGGVAGCLYLLWGQKSKKWGRAAFPCPGRAPPQAVRRPLLLQQQRHGGGCPGRGGHPAKGCVLPLSLRLVYQTLMAAGLPTTAVWALRPFPEVTCHASAFVDQYSPPWSPPSLLPLLLTAQKTSFCFSKKGKRLFSVF